MSTLRETAHALAVTLPPFAGAVWGIHFALGALL